MNQRIYRKKNLQLQRQKRWWWAGPVNPCDVRPALSASWFVFMEDGFAWTSHRHQVDLFDSFHKEKKKMMLTLLHIPPLPINPSSPPLRRRRCPPPMAAFAPQQSKPLVLGCGAVSVDYLATVASFPNPDDKIRSLALKVQGGGNAGNALTGAARLGLNPRIISKVKAAPAPASFTTTTHLIPSLDITPLIYVYACSHSLLLLLE